MVITIAFVLGWVITGVGVLCFWLCIRHPWGWFFGLGQQALYLIFAMLTGQWGFAAHGLIFAAIFMRNYIIDERARKRRLAKKARKAEKKAKKKAKKKGKNDEYVQLFDKDDRDSGHGGNR